MTTITTTFEVWDGEGKMHVRTTDEGEAQRVHDEVEATGAYVRVWRDLSWPCAKCGFVVYTSGGNDTDCDSCGASYNGSGQRLNDNWRDNWSNYDDEVSDLDGFEMAALLNWPSQSRYAAAILGIVHDREQISEDRLLALTADDVVDLYDRYIGPAVDAIESELTNG